MTDATTPTPTAGEQPQQGQPAAPGFRILAQYVRDMSFENPKAPESLRAEGKPTIDLGVEMNAMGRKDGLFEVDLKLSVKATVEAGPIFAVELVYGGLFQLMGVAEQDIEPMLMIECPRYLYPFAREIIARATSDGGLVPPFLMDPIDFSAIYAQRRAEMQRTPATA
jgi:preprotein translocase subunit SecB